MVQKINRDSYFIIDVKMDYGFKFNIAARGYNLKSWLDFQKKMGAEAKYREVSVHEYENKLWGKQ